MASDDTPRTYMLECLRSSREDALPRAIMP